MQIGSANKQLGRQTDSSLLMECVHRYQPLRNQGAEFKKPISKGGVEGYENDSTMVWAHSRIHVPCSEENRFECSLFLSSCLLSKLLLFFLFQGSISFPSFFLAFFFFFFFFFLFIFHLLSLFLSASWLFLSLCIPSCFPSSPCCECVSTMLYRHSLLSHHLVI